MTIASGTPPYFASSGAYRFLPSATDSTYAIVPLSGAVTASGGTHTYAKTGANTARLTLSDLQQGALTADATFTTASSGTFVVASVAAPSIKQTGTFTLFSGPAPADIAGQSITVTITSGGGVFAGAGSYRFQPAASGNTYNVVGLSLVPNSTGTYAYTKNSTYTGLIAFTDSITGTGQSAQMSFDTASSGTVLLLSAGLTGYQTGTFAVSSQPPSITTQPKSLTVVTGAVASFSGVAAGVAPLTYQWRKSGANVSGANAAAYSISNVTTNHAGNYQLVVSNAGGSVTSLVATLTVLVPPSFTLQPKSLTLSPTDTATFTSQATGTAPLFYQWRKGSSPLTGATNATFAINGIQGTDAGSYSVVVTNAAGSIISSNAVLTVNMAATVAPKLTALSWDRTNGFKQKADVQTGRAYRWQYSTNLPAWFDQTNFVAPGTTMELWDRLATNAPRRFYRVVSP
jgi:hypothetical protein